MYSMLQIITIKKRAKCYKYKSRKKDKIESLKKRK